MVLTMVNIFFRTKVRRRFRKILWPFQNMNFNMDKKKWRQVMPVKFDKRLSDFGSFLVRYLITTLNAGKLSHRSRLGKSLWVSWLVRSHYKHIYLLSWSHLYCGTRRWPRGRWHGRLESFLKGRGGRWGWQVLQVVLIKSKSIFRGCLQGVLHRNICRFAFGIVHAIKWGTETDFQTVGLTFMAIHGIIR